MLRVGKEKAEPSSLSFPVRKREVQEALMLTGYERDSRNSSGEQLALLGLCNVRSVGPGEPGYV